MPTESDLREHLHDGDGSDGSIDLDAVLRRSRARRRPRVVALAVGSTLAALAIVVPVSAGIVSSGASSSGSSASVADGGAPAKAPESVQGQGSGGQASDGRTVDGEDTTNMCTGALALPSPATNGLVLSVPPVSASAGDRGIPVTVTLTNTGSTSFTGWATPSPQLTLSRDGVVLWHSNGAVAQLAQMITLAPGAGTSFTATFDPVVCGLQDEQSFRAGLPAAGPGTYQLSALLDVSGDDGSSWTAVGPPSTVTLH